MATTNARKANLARSVSKLTDRLEAGDARIEQAVRQGQDVSKWEDFWIDLLHQLEMAEDELAGRTGQGGNR